MPLILQLSFSEKILSFCSWLAEQVSTVVNKVSRRSPEAHQPLVELIDSLKKKYSVSGAPWDVLLPTGSGTFEGYVGWGAGCGASADGLGFANGAEIDLKIMEDFKESDLVEFLRNYADLKGIGGNILTGDSC